MHILHATRLNPGAETNELNQLALDIGVSLPECQWCTPGSERKSVTLQAIDETGGPRESGSGVGAFVGQGRREAPAAGGGCQTEKTCGHAALS